MKIFAAGIVTETNTFSPVPTGLQDFRVQRGIDARAGRVQYPALDLSRGWGKLAAARGDELCFSLMAWAEPSGTTIRSAYEMLRDEILRDLSSAGPVDVILLFLHGAMVAQGYDNCEQDIISRVRQIAGPNATIGVLLDLHCNISESTLADADVVVIYKEYPHVDINDRSAELFQLTVGTQLGTIRPTMALFDCQMVGMYPTTREPMRGFVDSLLEGERRERVLSLSFAHGFQFADVAHLGAKMLVVTDGDAVLARALAREYGLRAYGMRREIGFESVSVPMEQALSRALASHRGPVIVADQSDNTGGGAPGDATFALRWLLQHGAQDVALAIFYDPEVVKIACKAGLGARLSVRLGGKTGPASGDPLDLPVTVVSIRHRYAHALPQANGEPWLYEAGDVVALRSGSIDIIVSSERCQCFSPSVFTDLGIDPMRKRVLIPKSYQHFHAAFTPIAVEVIYMAAPGAVMPDPRRTSYTRPDTARLYPWVESPIKTDV